MPKRGMPNPDQIGPMRRTDKGNSDEDLAKLLARRRLPMEPMEDADPGPLSILVDRRQIEELKTALIDFEDLLIRPDLAKKGKISFDEIKVRIKRELPNEIAENIITDMEEIKKKYEEEGKDVKQLRIDLNFLLKSVTEY
ncbi:MAG: hypothetical protein ABH835_03875 [Patescibacteria group bacterium]|nr:hypothetical protein [Patescibacteria group bacterium]